MSRAAPHPETRRLTKREVMERLNVGSALWAEVSRHPILVAGRRCIGRTVGWSSAAVALYIEQCAREPRTRVGEARSVEATS